MLGFGALNYLPVLFSLTLFVSILLSLTRCYRDSEMIVWFSAGVPLTAWVWPIVRFAAPTVLAIAGLTLVLSPWAVSKSAELRERLLARDDAAQVTPGVFRESSRADRVFFVEAGSDLKSAKNIFVSSLQHGRLGVMVSRRGYQEITPEGDRLVVMENGHRYEGTPGTAEYRTMRFERYALRVEQVEAARAVDSPKTKHVLELLVSSDRASRAELLRRIGIPLATLMLALLAIPLSFVNPRAGRANNLVLALLTFVLYGNLLSLSQAWVAQGKLSFAVGWWVVHVGMLAVLLLLFFRRIAVH